MTAGERAGVLLINLGTPDAPTAEAIRAYLREFLWDRDVIDLPRVLWWPVLHGVILPLRPRKLVPQYQHIWRNDGSPLLAISREQRTALDARFNRGTTPPLPVTKAMRYGRPGIDLALSKLRQAFVSRIVVLPLYPQYSGTTTGSALRAVEDALARMIWYPKVLAIQHYHEDPGYIGALASTVREHWAAHGRGDRLLVSFHSIPKRYVDNGDPYEVQCRRTAELLAGALQLRPQDWTLCYQSRIGRAQWLQPYTDRVIDALPGEGVRKLDVICPGFAAECLETLDEIVVRYAARFVAAGGEALRYVPALNARPDHIEALARIITKKLGSE